MKNNRAPLPELALSNRNPIGLPRWVWVSVMALATLLVAAGSLSAAADERANKGAIQCNVPSGSYPTIQSAHDDNCDEVFLVTGDYPEFLIITDRLTIIGPSDFSARIVGKVTVDTTDRVDLEFVTIVVGDDPSLIFGDGFETGNTNAWS